MNGSAHRLGRTRPSRVHGACTAKVDGCSRFGVTRLAILLLVVAPLLGASRPAWALFGSAGLDPSFCHQPTVRQTVVYIDDMMMAEGATDWAKRLAVKLRSTLTPGEVVTVVRLSPSSGQSHEYWNGCWPAYTAAQAAKLAQQTYILSANPLNTVGDQQAFFLRDLGAALTRIYLEARRPPAQVGVDAANPPQKQLLRALAADDGRFAGSTTILRAIVYSDLAENSDLGSVFHAAAEPVNYGQRLGSYLRRSVFYAFGMGEDVHGDADFQEQARTFWGHALQTMSAAVAGLGSDLNVPNTLPVASYVAGATLDFPGQSLDGRIVLLVGADGNLVDSYLAISRLGIAALTGTWRCDGAVACRLNSRTTAGIATTSPSEEVTLTGDARTMTGHLGIPGTDQIFLLKTATAEN
jgi:hypothetical protein